MFAKYNIDTTTLPIMVLGLILFVFIILFFHLYLKIARLRKEQQKRASELRQLTKELNQIAKYLPNLIKTEIFDFFKSEIPNLVKLQIYEMTTSKLDLIFEGKRHYLEKTTESAINDSLHTKLIPKLEELVSQELPVLTTESFEKALNSKVQKMLPDLVNSFINENLDSSIRKIIKEKVIREIVRTETAKKVIDGITSFSPYTKNIDLPEKKAINEMKTSVAASSPVRSR